MIWTGYANYQKEIAQDGRQQTVKATVTLKNGYVYNFTRADIMEHGLSFSDGTSEAGKLSVGSFIGKCLTLKLYNYDGHLVETQFDAALIGMWVGLVVDASITEWVYLGTFGVGEHAESGGIITLTAYDDSVKFDKKYDSTLPYPASLKGIVKDACAKCGVDWPDEDFANMNYTVNKRPNDDSITYADIVSYAAQLAGCYARINAYRQLIFGWYDMDRFYPNTGRLLDGGTFSSSPADTVDGGTFSGQSADTVFGGVFRQNLEPPAEIASLSSCTMPTEDIRVTGVKLVPTDSKKPTLIKGTDDYVVTIDKNPLAQGNIGYLLWNLAKQLIDFQFRPMEVSAWDNPSIEAGDVAYLTDTTGNRYKTIISNLTYEFGNYEKFSADAKSRADNDAERYSTSEKAASALDMRKNSDYITTGQISGDAAVQSVNEWNQILIDKNDIDELVKPRVDIIAQNRIAPRGPNATIEGEKNSAPGKAAHTEGSSNISSGKNSHTEGEGSSAPGDSAHAENSSLASGLCSHAENMGIASGPYSSAKGMGIASGLFSEASGGVSSILTPYDEPTYRNYFDGTHIPKKCYAPEASGEGARAHGIATLASGKLSEASGRNSTASGDYAYANGDNAHASASCAMSHGLDCTASGDDSYAGGRGSEAAATSAYAFGSGAKAKGYASCSFCGQTESDGNYSCSFGLDTVAHDANEFVIGRHNKVSAGDSANECLATNNAFVIGNGLDIANSNCFRVDFSGKVYGCAAFNTSGADYAEYFEWADENPNKQDRVGRFVTLDGAKIKFAKPGDDVLGIVSACPSVVGDAASESWDGRYARDVFGRPILDTELRFKENPEYKPEKEMDYVPREKRPEWSTVGMVGKTVLIDDGSCKPGGYCEPAADGTGIATATQGRNNCRVMERLDENHIRVCLK